mmetsp:Transcript_27857/g.82603  ORF Transcript_27857/g.82603 Transcript_27857/m.82603 type:complete len:231 (+) Transcript_27857:1863-2555(+)|eukprot:366131-Chlamydomonas_euryale.AAC.44
MSAWADHGPGRGLALLPLDVVSAWDGPDPCPGRGLRPSHDHGHSPDPGPGRDCGLGLGPDLGLGPSLGPGPDPGLGPDPGRGPGLLGLDAVFASGAPVHKDEHAPAPALAHVLGIRGQGDYCPFVHPFVCLQPWNCRHLGRGDAGGLKGPLGCPRPRRCRLRPRQKLQRRLLRPVQTCRRHCHHCRHLQVRLCRWLVDCPAADAPRRPCSLCQRPAAEHPARTSPPRAMT